MKNKWDCHRIIRVVCEPVEVILEQVGLSLLLSNSSIFSWQKGFLISYVGFKQMNVLPEKNVILLLDIIDTVEYIKTKYFKFIELDKNNGDVRFCNSMERNSDMIYFPICSVANDSIKEVVKKILETEKKIKFVVDKYAEQRK
jgi:hypothetical protein